jgi:hypothetical protein
MDLTLCLKTGCMATLVQRDKGWFSNHQANCSLELFGIAKTLMRTSNAERAALPPSLMGFSTGRKRMTIQLVFLLNTHFYFHLE